MEKRMQAVAALWNEGKDAKQIMEDLALSKGQTYRTLRRARALGWVAEKPAAQEPLRVINFGAMGPALDRQGDDFRSWLLDAVPDGLTVAEFAVACLLDIYDEEKENG